MNVYMHWDMEGVSGLFTREQTWYKEEGVRPEVAAEGIRLMIADVNAGVRAALAAGAERVFVCDTHGGGGNIILDEMFADPRVTYHGRSRALRDGKQRWMPDLDEQIDGLLLMGHHAKAGTPDAFLPHTWSSAEWSDFRINGESVGEIGIEACYAGSWDIPLILVHGTETACAETETQFPGAVTAAVKGDESYDRCSGLEPEAAHRLTAGKIAEALDRLRTQPPRPYKPSLPLRVTLRLHTPAIADRYAAKPHARRIDETAVEWTVPRQCDVVKWIANAGVD
jgi:D-amino peptidase